jgi:outer membrane protein assembly factor BamA
MIEGWGCGVAWRRVAMAAALIVVAPIPGLRAQAIECSAGDREVRSLEFHGEHAFSQAELALRVATKPSEFVRRLIRISGVRRCLDSDELRLDVGRLRIFYRRHGYYTTKVDTTVVPALDGFGGVKVAFLIQEGEPARVDTLRISGLDSNIAAIADTASLGLHRGMIFDVSTIQAAIDSIKSRLRNTGYPRGDVAAGFSVDSATKRIAAVKLDILPGALVHIGAIRISDEPLPGTPRRLNDRSIRQFIALREGDLYREREIIDAQRTLYQTDLFRHVEVGLSADSTATHGDSLVGVNVVVGENYMRQIDTEEGWAVLDCFKARVGVVDKNFLGDARRLELSAQVSKIGYGQPTRLANGGLCANAIREDTFSVKLNYFTGATLRLPSLFGTRTSPTLSLYSERRGEYQAFLRTTLVGGEASVAKEIARDIPLRLAYSLEYGRTEAQPALLCAVFNRCDAESRALITDRNRPLAVASAHLERLRTDNPINPHVGTALRLDLRGATKEIGSDKDIQFIKGLLDASIYVPAQRWMTLAARVRLGAVVGRTLSLGDAVGYIPPQERLYAGGAASVRGFQQNELGDLIYISESPFDTLPGATAGTSFLAVTDTARVRRVVPVGGNSLIVGNFEARMRSPFYPDLVQFTLFADAGDVWQRGRFPGASEHKASALWLNDLKWTPGIGIRVFTPVGPFQANVGYNPFTRPAGPIYYDQAPNAKGFAPLYCVSPGNTIAAVTNATGDLEQQSSSSCPATFRPGQSTSFFSRLTITFSIGPDF